MTLSIKDPEADSLARKLAKLTGGSITHAVIEALREERRKKKDVDLLVEEGMAIARHSASLPVIDDRSPEEIVGYDERGLPT